MFQNYALFPHLNVEKNILFALYDKKDKNQILNHLLKTFEIEDLRYKKIDEISGGQAQRVAFARAIARGCQLLLLDEPFLIWIKFKTGFKKRIEKNDRKSRHYGYYGNS